MSELVKKLEDLGRAFEDYKKVNDQRLEEIKKTGQASAETMQKLDRIEKDIQQFEDVKARLERVELAANRPGKGTDVDPQQEEHMQAFTAFLRDPTNPAVMANLKAASAKMAVSTDVGSVGYAVPEVIERRIIDKVTEISGFRNLARVVPAGSVDYKILVNVGGSAGGWVGEGDERTETATSVLKEVAPTFGSVYAYPQATEESLQDVFFNVEDWIVAEAAKTMAQLEGAALIGGNGTKKPTGLLAGATAATSDNASPARAFGTIEHIATGVAGAFPNDQMGSPPANPGDVLLDLVYALKKAYRQNAAFMLNKDTLRRVRKFKDKDGNYLWQPGLIAGQPSTLIGYRCEEDEEMADVASNSLPIAFGDFEAAYVIVDIAGTRITRDEVTKPGYVKFYVRRRVGGKLVNDEAVKVLKCAAS